MKQSTKLGLGLGSLVAFGNILHTKVEVIKQQPLETILACGVLITGITCVTMASDYTIKRITRYTTAPLGRYLGSKYKD